MSALVLVVHCDIFYQFNSNVQVMIAEMQLFIVYIKH